MHFLPTLIAILLYSFPQDYVYPDAKDRQFLHYFYKGASKKKFNVVKYNELKDEEAQVGCFTFYNTTLATSIATWYRHLGHS